MNKSQINLKAAPGERIGIIYSVPNLGEYIVEIIEHDKTKIIPFSNDITRFANLNDAKATIIENNVTRAYLALDKTYEEPGLIATMKKIINYDYLSLIVSKE